jgi:hypothetical protein
MYVNIFRAATLAAVPNSSTFKEETEIDLSRSIIDLAICALFSSFAHVLT